MDILPVKRQWKVLTTKVQRRAMEKVAAPAVEISAARIGTTTICTCTLAPRTKPPRSWSKQPLTPPNCKYRGIWIF